MHLLFSFLLLRSFSFFFFFNDTATTEIYTLSLHDALPISSRLTSGSPKSSVFFSRSKSSKLIVHETSPSSDVALSDRKSTRLNSSHTVISYAVFCLKKKKKYIKHVIVFIV